MGPLTLLLLTIGFLRWRELILTIRIYEGSLAEHKVMDGDNGKTRMAVTAPMTLGERDKRLRREGEG